MYQRCPVCQAAQAANAQRCAACGLDFRVWLKSQLQAAHQAEYGELEAEPQSSPSPAADRDSFATRLADTLLAVYPTDALNFWARVLLYLGLLVWGWYFIGLDFRSNAIGNSFLHGVNLVFHEAGHVIFSLFGDFMRVFGGTLGQLLMPLIVAGTFLIKQGDNFGASVGLWWFSQSLMDCAPYINDARAGELLLLGGVTGNDVPGYHDWTNLLGRMGLLAYDQRIAHAVDLLGSLLMLLVLAWGGVLLYRQWRVCRDV